MECSSSCSSRHDVRRWLGLTGNSVSKNPWSVLRAPTTSKNIARSWVHHLHKLSIHEYVHRYDWRHGWSHEFCKKLLLFVMASYLLLPNLFNNYVQPIEHAHNKYCMWAQHDVVCWTSVTFNFTFQSCNDRHYTTCWISKMTFMLVWTEQNPQSSSSATVNIHTWSLILSRLVTCVNHVVQIINDIIHPKALLSSNPKMLVEDCYHDSHALS